jgi:Cd2+/Zn2+-exporting ATPase
MLEKVYILEGLTCPKCATQIGDEMRRAEGVVSADVDLISKQLKLKVREGSDLREMTKKVKAVVRSLEPHVRVREEAISSGRSSLKWEALRLAFGAAAFAFALIADLSQSAKLAVFLASYAVLGIKVFFAAAKAILRGRIFTEYLLMSVATAGAFIIGEYPEGVAVMLFYLVGEVLQEAAVNRSRRAIVSLLEIKPSYANVLRGAKLEKVLPESVGVGEIIVVKPGERVPLDGTVIEGSSAVDTSALTGEALPKMIGTGETVFSGYINKDGMLKAEVARKYSDSTVAKILELVKSSGRKKARAERFISKFAGFYTPAVVLAAAALAVIPPLAIQGATFSEWAYRALVFLVISCPCALVISIPLGFFGGIGGASRKGILIKGAIYLDALASAWAVAFDKTGTLTEGRFKVSKVVPKESFSEDELLEYAAFAESFSNHPIAISVTEAYKGEIDRGKISDFLEVSGEGVSARIGGKSVLCGSWRFMKDRGIECGQPQEGGTAVHVAVEGAYAGYILVEDAVKADAKAAIAELRRLGVKKALMLSGDTMDVATRVAAELGIDEVRSQLLPGDKVREIEKLDAQKPRGKKIVYVGDGINDAPVIARADVGVAMGGLGSVAAIEAADIVIMTDEPKKVAAAIRVARKTKKIVIQNIILSLGVKLAVLVLGALGQASMWMAVFADIGVSLIAILNSMRALAVKA